MCISSYSSQVRRVCASLAISLAIIGSAAAQDLSASQPVAIAHARSAASGAPPSDYAANNTNPLFPGGNKAMHAYLDQQISYPVQARSAGLEGLVRVRFRVQPTGQLTHIRVVQSAGKLLDKAALRVISAMPPWFPAQQHGDAVLSAMELPVVFRLD